jgi:hypothetical protein
MQQGSTNSAKQTVEVQSVNLKHTTMTGQPASGRMNRTLISFGLFTLTVVVFLPVLRNGFVNYDDPWYVTQNLHVTTGFTWDNIRWAFTNLQDGLWHPLIWLSHMLDCELFGLNPAGHHLTGVLLHAFTTLALYRALEQLTGANWRSATVAALFAFHPLHVETVAWVSDRKDALAGCFWALTMLSYAAYAKESKVGGRRRSTYLLTLALFICGLMSKSTVMTLPMILLLFDWWPLGRFKLEAYRNWRVTILPLIWEKLPFLAAAVLVAWLGVRGSEQIGAAGNLQQFPLDGRVQNAVLAYGHYLVQTFWPSVSLLSVPKGVLQIAGLGDGIFGLGDFHWYSAGLAESSLRGHRLDMVRSYLVPGNWADSNWPTRAR